MCYLAMSVSKVTQHWWQMNELVWGISEMMLTGYYQSTHRKLYQKTCTVQKLAIKNI